MSIAAVAVRRWATFLAGRPFGQRVRLLPIGATIAMALILNFCAAATAGVLLPLLLKRMNIDPAVAGTVVVTAVTDVMGFFCFLGLATLILLH